MSISSDYAPLILNLAIQTLRDCAPHLSARQCAELSTLLENRAGRFGVDSLHRQHQKPQQVGHVEQCSQRVDLCDGCDLVLPVDYVCDLRGNHVLNFCKECFGDRFEKI